MEDKIRSGGRKAESRKGKDRRPSRCEEGKGRLKGGRRDDESVRVIDLIVVSAVRQLLTKSV